MISDVMSFKAQAFVIDYVYDEHDNIKIQPSPHERYEVIVNGQTRGYVLCEYTKWFNRIPEEAADAFDIEFICQVKDIITFEIDY